MKRIPIQPDVRTGITLMEVLIAIGILAVGLSSVAALLPAGGSQAKNAVMADRAATLAENALADAVTAGLIRPAALTGGGSRIVLDPIGDPGLAGLTYRSLTDAGVYGGGGAVSSAVTQLFGQLRDDVLFNDPATADSLPTNLLIEGSRGYLGRTSCLWAIESLDGTAITGGQQARLSVVLFHERGVSWSGTINDTGVISVTSLPSGISLKQVFRPGTVVLRSVPNSSQSPSLYVLRAAPTASTLSVYSIVDDTRLWAPAGTTEPVTVLVGSVGLAQRIVTLEGNSEYSWPGARRVTP
jgi:type II secretory pathway pseudopilin PulG